MSKLNPMSAFEFIIAFDICCCTPIDIDGLLLLLLLVLLLLLLFAVPIIEFGPPIGLWAGRTLFSCCVLPLTTALSSCRTNSDEFMLGLLTPWKNIWTQKNNIEFGSFVKGFHILLSVMLCVMTNEISMQITNDRIVLCELLHLSKINHKQWTIYQP